MFLKKLYFFEKWPRHELLVDAESDNGKMSMRYRLFLTKTEGASGGCRVEWGKILKSGMTGGH